MNTNQTPTAEIALLIFALEGVYVADMEKVRQKLLTELKGEMEKRGVKSFDSQRDLKPNQRENEEC